MVVAANQKGFVLATTVWMIAILTLLGSLFHGYIRSQLEQALTVRKHLEQAIELESSAQTLRYLMITRRITAVIAGPRGLLF